MSSIYNIAFSSEKKLSRLNQERNMYRSSIVYKRKQSKTALNKHISGFWCERTTGDGTDRLECGLFWCFISWLESHSDGTHSHPLVSKWCNATFLQICSDEETNSSTSWMAWGWVNCQQLFIFEWTIPLCYCVYRTTKNTFLFCVVIGYAAKCLDLVLMQTFSYTNSNMCVCVCVCMCVCACVRGW